MLCPEPSPQSADLNVMKDDFVVCDLSNNRDILEPEEHSTEL